MRSQQRSFRTWGYALKPRIRGDVYFTSYAEGVYFVSNRGTTTFRGNDIYNWVERLVPHLDGTRSLDAITNGLPSDKRQIVNNIVAALLNNGLAKDASVEDAHELTQSEQEIYSAEITYLDYFVASPARKFQAWRQARTLILAPPHVAAALTYAALHAGLCHLSVATTAPSAGFRARIEEFVLLAQPEDSAQAAELHDCGDPRWATKISHLLKASDLALYVPDAPSIYELDRFERQCDRAGVFLVPALIGPEAAWVGPVGTPQDSTLSVRSALCRLTESGSWRQHISAAAQLTDSTGEIIAARPAVSLSGPAASMVANLMCMAAFRCMTQADGDSAQCTVTELNLSTLSTTRRTVTRHPFGSRASVRSRNEFLARVGALQRGDPIDEAGFSQQVREILDERAGVLMSLSEHDYIQLPLNASQMLVSDPTRTAADSNSAPLCVLGAGADLRSARLDAAWRALELYCSRVLDPRRLCNEQGAALRLPQGGSLSELLTSRDTARGEGWVWGYDLEAKCARILSASEVFSSVLPSFAGPAPLGVAAADTWQAAVLRGLLDWSIGIALQQAVSGETTPVTVDVEADDDSSAKAHKLLHDLRDMGVRYTALDISGDGVVPVVAWLIEGTTITATAGRSISDAIDTGLHRLVQWSQAKLRNDILWQHLALPPLTPAAPARAVSQLKPRYAPLTYTEVLSATLRGDRRACVVPLDHDPVVASVAPYCLRLLLTASGRT